MAIEKIKILGISYQLNSTANPAHLAHFCGKYRPPGFGFFQLHLVPIIHLR
jgi:hypothetical protein